MRAERGSCEAATDTGIARTGIPGTDDPHASPCTGDWVALRPAFAEIEHLAQDCRFTDCAHEYEPGCAVLAAVETGEIGQRRLDSYHKLLRENAYAASRTDARLRADRGAVKKDITRHLRATYQFRERQR